MSPTITLDSPTLPEMPDLGDAVATPRDPGPLASRLASWAGELVELARLPFVPTQSERLGRLYDIVGTRNLFSEASLFVNLGFWRNGPRSLDEAAVELARLVARAADLQPGDRVLDVGCGFGDQDLVWAQEFMPAEIIGANVSDEQIRVAERRVRERGLQERIRYVHGSAIDLPQADNSVTKVTALESAFHFPSRRRFFEEAYRVLEPGGRLVAADIVLRSVPGQRWLGAPLRRLAGNPRFQRIPNVFDNELLDARGYGDVLRTAGFDGVHVESIRADVYPPLCRYLARRVGDPDMQGVNPALRLAFRPPVADVWTYFADYVIAVAHRS